TGLSAIDYGIADWSVDGDRVGDRGVARCGNGRRACAGYRPRRRAGEDAIETAAAEWGRTGIGQPVGQHIDDGDGTGGCDAAAVADHQVERERIARIMRLRIRMRFGEADLRRVLADIDIECATRGDVV